MKIKGSLRCIILFMLVALPARTAWAQYQLQHQPPTVVKRGETVRLAFSMPAVNPSDVVEASVFYKFDGGVSYKQKEARFDQSVFKSQFVVPDDAGGSLSYYFQLQLKSGQTIYYPENKMLSGPVRVDVIDSHRNKNSSDEKKEGVEYTILSPARGETVAYNDVVIAVSLFYDAEKIDSTQNFKLYLDEHDVTDKADASDYFLSYVPDQLAPGAHHASLVFAKGDSAQQIVSWQFLVSQDQTVTEAEAGQAYRVARGIPSGQVELRARSQALGGNSTDIYSGNLRLSGHTKNIRYSVYGLLTSQEDPRFQSQNRYGVEVYAGDWFELQGGHIYPMLSPLTISGQRVFGINTGLHVWQNAVNLEFLYGRLQRSVSTLYAPVNRHIQRFNHGATDTTYTLNFRPNGLGTYRRNIIGGKLGFGRGEHFEFDINMLKVEDDTNSISTINNFTELMNQASGMADDLSTSERQRLTENPSLLSVNENPRPKGNLVTGADLMFSFDEHRIRFESNNALSLLDEDISGGALTRQRAEELGFELDEDVENTLEQLSWLIIINENLSSLPIRFDDEGNFSRFEFPMGTVASQSELSLNYFNNNLRLRYRWVGPNYQSLANSTVRRDIAGLTVNDRIWLLGNKLYLTLGYDYLHDNLADFKSSTTNTMRFSGSVSWYPIRPDLPRVSVGVSDRVRDNDVDLFNPYVPPGWSGAGVRNFKQQNGEVIVAPKPVMANTFQFNSSISQQLHLFGLSQDARLSYSWLNTVDDAFAYGNARSSSFSFRLNNRFDSLPLDTNIGVNYNETQAYSGLTDIKIYGFNLGGTMNLLESKLNLSANIAFTKNHSEVTSLMVNDNYTTQNGFDDYYEASKEPIVSESNAYIFSANGQYHVTAHHAFAISARLTNVSNTLTANPIPGDHVLQARYIFTF